MPFRDYIAHNFWWKLLSLLLASLTWLTIETAFQKDQSLRESPVVTSSTRTFPAVPITLLTAASNPNQFKIDPLTVSVDVSGLADRLAKLQEKQIRVFVDVSDAGEEKKFRRNIQAQVPGGLKVEHVIPTYASVEHLMTAK